MTTDKNEKGQPEPADVQQSIADRDAPLNPFRDAKASEAEQTPEEQTALEQQRKEALTERD